MADYPLIVFATSSTPVPLVALKNVLAAASAPANLGVDIAGEATEEQLRDPAWETALLRWTEPELHDVALIERLPRTDDEAGGLVVAHQELIETSDDTAGRMIVADYLGRTQIVYAVQLLPALLAADGHDAWSAIDALLRFVAIASDGVIYVEAEGYCDADGELMLAEGAALNDVDPSELD